MISVEAARQRLFEFPTQQLDSETLSLENALHRFSAETVMAKEALPLWNNSAMDGYAIQIETDTSAGKQFKVSAEIAAGDSPCPLASGTAARIFTGAPMPVGANTVVIQENCEIIESDAGGKALSVKLTTLVKPTANVRPKGQDITDGDTLIQPGERITPQKLTLLAACGKATLKVFKPLRIGILTTGSEIVEANQTRPPYGLYNSNGPMLKALCNALSVKIVHAAHVVDDLNSTQNELSSCAQQCDLILTSGGVSVGDKDFVKTAITALGKIDFWKIQMKPGKPFAFGFIGNNLTKNQIPVLSLPGNPASAFVTFLLFVKAVILSAYQQPYAPLKTHWAPANFSLEKKRLRPEYARAMLTETGVQLCGNQSSGMVSPLASCDGLALLAPDKTIKQGDLIPFFNIYDLIYR